VRPIPSRVTSVDELDEAAFASAGRILLVKKGELAFLEDAKNSYQEISS
jgi:hypothetical protein